MQTGYKSILEIKSNRSLKSQDTDGVPILIGAEPPCGTVAPTLFAIRNHSTRITYLERDRECLKDVVICQDCRASVVGELWSKELWQMTVTSQSRSTQRDAVPLPLRPPQIPVDRPEVEIA
jgi:hypothetical protein